MNDHLTNLTRRNFLKGVAAASVAVAGAGALTGCGAGQGGANGAKVFRFGQKNPKVPFDCQRSSNAAASTVGESMMESLLYWNDDLELIPVLVTQMPTWSDDHKTLTCQLKQGVKFHNGADLTTKDVKYSFERMFKPEIAANNTYMYDAIVGAKEMMEGQATELAGLELLDDYNFKFHLKEPFVQFVNNLGLSYAPIMPHEAAEAAGKDWGQDGKLIGTGPYKFVSGDTNKIVMEANKDWHQGTPNLDGVEIHFIDDDNTKMLNYVKGDIDACDLAATLYPQYKDDATVSPQIHHYTPLGTRFINLNLKDPALSDVNVRKALSMGINRQELIDSVLNGQGEPCTCFINPKMPGHYADEGVFPYDPETAKEILAKAGKSNLKLTAKTRSGVDSAIMTAVQAYWKKIGVDLDVQQVDSGVWADDWKSGNIQVMCISWHPLYPDAENHMNAYFRSTAAKKKSCFYDNPEFDKLMDESRAIEDPQKRGELFKKADKMVTWRDYACLPISWDKFSFVAKDNVQMKVGNLIYHTKDVTMNG